MIPDDQVRPGPLGLIGMGWFPDQSGGLNRYLRDLAEALRRSGVHAHAVLIGPATAAPAWVTAVGHHTEPVVVRLIRLVGAARDLRPQARVVDVHFALYGLLPILGPLRRVPLVVHFQGPWASESAAGGETGLRPGLKRLIERQVYRRADQLIVLCAEFKRILVEDYGVAPWRIDVIPPGVDLHRFRPGASAASRRRLGIPEDAWVAVAVRRLVPRMGLDVLLRAWAEVGDDGLLLVAGDGPERRRLERAAEARGSDSRVRFLGHVAEAELPHLYRAADVVVMPSLALEGFGLVTLESLACGTPVIGSATGGIPDALKGLDPSLLLPPGDHLALAGRLHAARNGGRPLPTRERCRAHAERFSWDDVAERTLDVYTRAARPLAQRRLRVVYLDHTAQLSGGEIALARMLPALGELDAHVVLAQDGPLASRLQADGISAEVLPLAEHTRALPRAQVRVGRRSLGGLVSALGYVVRLAVRLRRLRPDIVHTNSLKAALYGGLAGRLAGVPVVWHIRDRIAPDYLPKAAVRLVRMAARRLPAAMIVNSRTTAATLRPSSTSVVTDAIPQPPDSFCADGDASRRLRVGIVGRLSPWKGQDVFLRAFAQAFPDGREQAVVVGSPLFGETAFEAELRGLATSLGVDGRVHFRGFREDIWAELARIDVLVHASVIPEPLGMVVVEGMAAGLAVVAADAGGPAEVVTHDVNGLLYPPGDTAALAETLRLLARDRTLRERLGVAGRARAQDFRPERIAPKIVDVYRQVLSAR